MRVQLGSSSTYAGGFTLPEGDYALFFDCRQHAYTKQDGTKGQDMLGIMVTAFPLEGGEGHEVFYSLGRKALASFVPDTDTPSWNGKGSTGLVPIPGQSGTLSRNTNWDLLRRSLIDCDPAVEALLDEGLDKLDGVWAHMKPEKAPEERKSYGAQTGEVQQEQRDQMIAIVTEIKDDGKPWEDTGGMPEGAVQEEAPKPKAAAPKSVTRPAFKPVAGAVKPTAVAPKTAIKAVTKPNGKIKPAAAPEPEEDENLQQYAQEGAASVIEANPKGTTKIALRTGAFKYVSSTYGEDAADKVISTFFEDEAALAGILGELGYEVKGPSVKPSA